MLERQGYTVLAASTPGEAIRLAREHAGEIHLLMTDVVMPEMNGRDLAKNLLSLYPDLKRLFMSGYTADVIAHHGVLDRACTSSRSRSPKGWPPRCARCWIMEKIKNHHSANKTLHRAQAELNAARAGLEAVAGQDADGLRVCRANARPRRNSCVRPMTNGENP